MKINQADGLIKEPKNGRMFVFVAIRDAAVLDSFRGDIGDYKT